MNTMKKLNTPLRPTELRIDPTVIEKKRNAIYVGDFCISQSGQWINRPCQIYYQEQAPVLGYSNYFAVFVNEEGQAMITSGKSIEGLEFDAIEHNGQILYSAYRYDYRADKSGSVAIDGGRDYTRIIGTPQRSMRLKIVGPDIFEIDGR